MRKPLEGAKRISGPYPYYGASGIVDYVDGYLFDEELILLSEDGANITDRNYPVCFLASGKYWVNNHAHVLRTKQGNENNFICNSLERKDYTQYNTGMAMPKLNKETCKKIPILCPGFEEQKKIGDYFRSLDNLITLHHRKYSKTWDYKGNGGFLPTKNKSSVRKIQIDWQIVVKFSEVTKGLPENEPIFVGETKIYNSTVNDVLTRHCKACGISEISIHGLRHTHASLLLFAGVSIASVARRLGHASMTTTQKTYLHIIQELENKDVDLVMRTLSGL